MSAYLRRTEIITCDGKTQTINIGGDFPPQIINDYEGPHILSISMGMDMSDELCVNFVLKSENGNDVKGVVIPVHPMFSFAYQREVLKSGGEIASPAMDPIKGMQALENQLKDIVDFTR